jgi:hypothetical protein
VTGTTSRILLSDNTNKCAGSPIRGGFCFFK